MKTLLKGLILTSLLAVAFGCGEKAEDGATANATDNSASAPMSPSTNPAKAAGGAKPSGMNPNSLGLPPGQSGDGNFGAKSK